MPFHWHCLLEEHSGGERSHLWHSTASLPSETRAEELSKACYLPLVSTIPAPHHPLAAKLIQSFGVISPSPWEVLCLIFFLFLSFYLQAARDLTQFKTNIPSLFHFPNKHTMKLHREWSRLHWLSSRVSVGKFVQIFINDVRWGRINFIHSGQNENSQAVLIESASLLHFVNLYKCLFKTKPKNSELQHFQAKNRNN